MNMFMVKEKSEWLTVLNIGRYEGATKDNSEIFDGAEFFRVTVKSNGDTVKEFLLAIFAEHENFVFRVQSHYDEIEKRKLSTRENLRVEYKKLTEKEFKEMFFSVPTITARLIDDCGDNTATCRYYQWAGI